MSTAFRSAFAAASRRPVATLSSASIAPARTAFQAHSHARYRGFSTGNEYAGSSRGPGPFRRWATRFGILLAIPVVYVAGAVFPPTLVLLLYPRYSPPPPDKDSTRGKAITCEVEKDAQGLSIVEKMRAAEGWYETRPYQQYDPNKIHNSLTAGSLRGPGRLAIPPLLFAKHDESEAIAIVHMGRALCGHDGIIHGGLIATVFDETLARNALLNLPTHIGVTASLTIDYKAPTQADQFIIVRTKLEKKNGRKVNVSGSMETLEGQKLAEARALFIEPKWAQFLQSSGVTEAMGKPMAIPTKAERDQGAFERVV